MIKSSIFNTLLEFQCIVCACSPETNDVRMMLIAFAKPTSLLLDRRQATDIFFTSAG